MIKTDDTDNNIKIVREPSFEDYGTVAVFEDLYGNLWDLIEPRKTEQKFYSTGILKVKVKFRASKSPHLGGKT